MAPDSSMGDRKAARPQNGRRWGLGLLVFAAYLLVATDVLAAPTLAIGAPTAGAIAGTTLSVRVNVISTYAVQSVSAQVGNVSGNLEPPSASSLPWSGTLAISGLPYGSQTLTITATDILAETSSATVAFFHDNPPVIQVSSPTYGAVAHPTVNLTATCTDDTECRSIRAFVGPQLVATGQGSISQNGVDLSMYDGQEIDIAFTAEDSLNGGPTSAWTTTVQARVFVDTSPRLVEVASVSGMVLDLDSTRILYRKSDGSIVLRDRRTQVDATLGMSQQVGSVPVPGFLTSTGAAWFSNVGATPVCSIETIVAFTWTGSGQATKGDARCNSYPFVVAGDWAMSYTADGFELLNLTNNTKTQHPFPTPSNDAGTTGGRQEGVPTKSGDIFGIVDEPDLVTLTLYRDHQGVVTRLGGLSGRQGRSLLPLTDGTNLVYNAFDLRNDQYSIHLFSDGVETPIGQPRGANYIPLADFQIANGWLAFKKRSVGVDQVWLRSPQAAETQLSIFNTDSTIDALSDVGEVMFLTDGKRYLGAPSVAPDAINSALGKAMSQCDGWYVSMGGSVFKVSGTRDTGAACPTVDAGTSDAPRPTGDADASLDGGGTSTEASDSGSPIESGELLDQGSPESSVIADVVVREASFVPDAVVRTDGSDGSLDRDAGSFDGGALDSGDSGAPSDGCSAGCRIGGDRGPSDARWGGLIAACALALRLRPRRVRGASRDHRSACARSDRPARPY